MSPLAIGGLVPFSTVDMPGRNAAVVFCQGCPWRCRYCHNGHLQGGAARPALDWPRFLDWLEARRGFLEAVVFSGGEPTLQPALGPALGAVRAMGFGVGLHSAGPRPELLRPLLPLLDWIGLDIKAPRRAYDRITGVAGSGVAAWESLGMVLDSGLDYQLRTTCHADLLSPADLEELAGELAGAGARTWVLQPFRIQGCGDPGLAGERPPLLTEALVAGLQARLTAA